MDTLAKTHTHTHIDTQTDRWVGGGRGRSTVGSYLQVRLDQWQQGKGHKGHGWVAAGGRREGRRGLERDSMASVRGRGFGTSRADERVSGAVVRG